MNIRENSREIVNGERGATLIVATLILVLLTVFVAGALTSTTSSAVSTNNDAGTAQAFYASYAGLEMMTKKFSDFFVNSTRLTDAQVTEVINYKPGDVPANIAFQQELKYLGRVSDGTDGTIELKVGPYAGLRALRDEYFLSSTATTGNGVQVQLTRSFFNNLIPIFQFGIFSTRHLEFYNGPRFSFGGRVHANGNIYMNPQFGDGTTANNGLFFNSRITLTGELIRDIMRNGVDRKSTGRVFVNNPTGAAKELAGPGSTMASFKYKKSGSVEGGPQTGTSVDPLGQPLKTAENPFFFNTLLPPLGGQLIVKAPPLRLPFENSSGINGGNNRPIELIRRGLPDEDPATNPIGAARFFNKPGLRITISDKREQLPGGTGGIELNTRVDPATGNTYTDNRYGYLPKPLGNYQASRINGHRLRGWIKIELVDPQMDGTVKVTDVTEPILAFGVTRYDLEIDATTNRPRDLDDLRAAYAGLVPVGKELDDRKSIIRLQRYALLKTEGNDALTIDEPGTGNDMRLADDDTRVNRSKNYLRRQRMNGDPSGTDPADQVQPDFPANGDGCNATNRYDTPAVVLPACSGQVAQLYNPNFTAPAKPKPLLIAYPITMFDTREGRYLDNLNDTAANQVEVRGIMSLVDVDMQNLKRLLSGDFDADLNSGGFGLRSNMIPRTSNGFIVYISDRRGDTFAPAGATAEVIANLHDGKYDLETVYGKKGTGEYIPRKNPQKDTLFFIEDTNDNNEIETVSATNREGGAFNERLNIIEAVTKGPWHPDAGGALPRIDMSTDTFNDPANIETTIRRQVFRRAVRLTNGEDLSSAVLNENVGLAVATENPIYIQGNYNSRPPTANLGSPTAPENYNGPQVPASVIADAVTLLSNSWLDFRSFTEPYVANNRNASDTSYRVAVLAGRVRDGLFIDNNDEVPWGTKGNSGLVGGANEEDDVRLYGGVHNFLRYLEDWNSKRLFYVGSIIDGWDSWQANGSYKCCDTVYRPPTRDYTFNTTFLDPRRLPPGTPNLQYILFTSFRKNVNPFRNVLSK